MLILTRKPGESVYIDLIEDLDPRTPIGDVFKDRRIEITVARIRGDQVKLGVRADPRLRILRAELTARRSIRIAHPAAD